MYIYIYIHYITSCDLPYHTTLRSSIISYIIIYRYRYRYRYRYIEREGLSDYMYINYDIYIYIGTTY